MSKRQEPQAVANRTRHFAGGATDARDQGGQRPGCRRLRPSGVLLHGAGPPAEGTGELRHERSRSGPWSTDPKQETARVNRVHLLVLPRPRDPMANDVPDVIGQRKGIESPLDRFVSVGDGHDLLALHGEQQQGGQLAQRMVVVSGALAREGCLELRDDVLRQYV